MTICRCQTYLCPHLEQSKRRSTTDDRMITVIIVIINITAIIITAIMPVQCRRSPHWGRHSIFGQGWVCSPVIILILIILPYDFGWGLSLLLSSLSFLLPPSSSPSSPSSSSSVEGVLAQPSPMFVKSDRQRIASHQ